jgi:hypothetical protein
MIPLEQWRDVLAVEGRAVVLQVASSGGWDAVVLYLEQIRGSGKKETGGDPLAGRARSSGCR